MQLEGMDADALIFDLRRDGGGGDMAGYLLSYFLPPESIIGELRSRTARREIRTLARVGGGRRLEVPLYVLLSGQSASAAEVFAYSPVATETVRYASKAESC